MDQQIIQVIQNLRALFANKDRLVGIGDWDCLIGCLIALENIAAALQTAGSQPQEETAEE